jgi:hypothetical protein
VQQLSRKLKNVPTNTQLVCSSTNSVLNRDQSLSVQNKVLLDNNSEVDPLQHTGGQNLRVSVNVYVLNKRGKPLMPTIPRKAKLLLKEKKAKIVSHSPFVIQLNYATGETKQEVTLGIDVGYRNIGFSAVTDKKELISGEVKLDGKTKERLDEKRMYRRNRRSRHYWYRKSRFLNRTKKEGWLAPSVQRRYNTHLSLINKIKNILLITKVIIEIAKFDIQKLENPKISSKDYQQGDMFEYQNIRSYLISREKGKCEHCEKDFKNNPSHIHHRKQRNDLGSNRLENLMLLHKSCHIKIHKSVKLLKKYEKSSVKEYKKSTFMSIINKKFYNDIEDLEITYGYITFVNRNKLGLEKSHINDAFVISGGTDETRCNSFEIIQKHRNNRVLQCNRKGFIPSIRKQRYKIQAGDLFWVNSKKYVSNGMFGNGKYILYGNIKKKEYFKIEKVEKYFNQKSLI